MTLIKHPYNSTTPISDMVTAMIMKANKNKTIARVMKTRAAVLMKLIHDVKLKRLYDTNRYSAKQRNIPFYLTYQQWLYIWLASGKLNERGKMAHQYCLARFGDQGAYELGNVKIITNSANCSENSCRKHMRPFPISVRVAIDGIEFPSYKKAADYLKLHKQVVRRRCISKNKKYVDWKILS